MALFTIYSVTFRANHNCWVWANKVSSGDDVVKTERTELSYRALRGIITSFGSVQPAAVKLRNVTSGVLLYSKMKLVVPQYISMASAPVPLCYNWNTSRRWEPPVGSK